MTLKQFLDACPEFKDTDYDLIQNTLDEAANELDPVAWGGLYDSGHKYLCAHKLALSPEGQNARMVQMVAGRAVTTYLTHFNDLALKLGLGVGVS